MNNCPERAHRVDFPMSVFLSQTYKSEPISPGPELRNEPADVAALRNCFASEERLGPLFVTCNCSNGPPHVWRYTLGELRESRTATCNIYLDAGNVCDPSGPKVQNEGPSCRGNRKHMRCRRPGKHHYPQ